MPSLRSWWTRAGRSIVTACLTPALFVCIHIWSLGVLSFYFLGKKLSRKRKGALILEESLSHAIGARRDRRLHSSHRFYLFFFKSYFISEGAFEPIGVSRVSEIELEGRRRGAFGPTKLLRMEGEWWVGLAKCFHWKTPFVPSAESENRKNKKK